MKQKFIFVFISVVVISQITLSGLPDTTRNYTIEHESQLSKKGAGPHKGKGEATAYVFFKDIKDITFSFQKHVLHAGSEVGYHKQEKDEVYYIVSGSGKIVIDDNFFDVRQGDAILTRKGSYHGMIQSGNEDLVFIVTYPKN